MPPACTRALFRSIGVGVVVTRARALGGTDGSGATGGGAGSWYRLAFLGGWKSNSDAGSVGLRSIRS